MEAKAMVVCASILGAAICIAIGSIGPALAEGRAAASAFDAMARQPDQSKALTRLLFVAMAMIESTAIYCLVIALILIFANPFPKLFG